MSLRRGFTSRTSRSHTPAASCAASCPRSWPRASQRLLCSRTPTEDELSDLGALGSVRPFDDLLEGRTGHYVLQATDHDRCVLDEVGVALVGARAAVGGLQEASETGYSPLPIP